MPLDALEREPDAAPSTRAVPLARMLPALAAVALTADGVRRAVHGRDLGPADLAPGAVPGGRRRTSRPAVVRLLDPAGELVGIAEPAALAGLLHPSVVLM